MAATASSDVTDGPVLGLINKRLRALRKKLNRITLMEESISQGKPINKEQEGVLQSKPAVTAAIDELEKLRQPLSAAVNEEISLAIESRHVADKDKAYDDIKGEQSETLAVEEDLLSLIYFASMFDVKSQSDFNNIMLTRTHERNCCLTYDYVTDDDADVMLGETDLDLISRMGSLLISRPVDSSFSHQNALQRCIQHAKLWLEKSEQPIDLNSDVTYASLREKLTKIIGSDFFKITPEMKATTDVAAAAAGNYASFDVSAASVEGSIDHYDQKEEVADFQRSETYEDQSSPVEELHKDNLEAENSVEIPIQSEPIEQHAAGGEFKEQQYVHRRPYQNQRGVGRNGGGRRGGYSNGRGGRSGGRGGGGPYQNGRNQYYDQPGNYYPRNNYYNNNRGRGGRNTGGNGGNSYNHASGVQVADS